MEEKMEESRRPGFESRPEHHSDMQEIDMRG